ncbi:hypothetical protein YTPLAS18_29450 [Nitrospira sp.]|nr:hypothetical protein YTPLAS18_29450 [Nitrospira sp.]
MTTPPPDPPEQTAEDLSPEETAYRRRERSVTATVVGLILLFALYSLNRPSERPPAPNEPAKPGPQLKADMVPLVTGEESLQAMFTKAGCPVCHTIPGIEGAQGREGPPLRLGVTGPQRLADPEYKGQAKTVREYIVESITNPGAYIVPGYPTHAMPRWYGQKLSASALDQIAGYLEQLQDGESGKQAAGP